MTLESHSLRLSLRVVLGRPLTATGEPPAMLSTPPTRNSQPHVSYVLLAEFDIDEGSILKHQYPAATGVDEQ